MITDVQVTYGSTLVEGHHWHKVTGRDHHAADVNKANTTSVYLWYQNAPGELPVLDITLVRGDEEVPEGYTKVATNVNKGGSEPAFLALRRGEAREGIPGVSALEVSFTEDGYEPPHRRMTAPLNVDGAPAYLWMHMKEPETARALAEFDPLKLVEGDWIDCRDNVKRWRMAKVTEAFDDPVDGRRMLKVQYKGWRSSWAEQVPAQSRRVARVHQHTTKSDESAGSVFRPIIGGLCDITPDDLDTIEARVAEMMAGTLSDDERERLFKGDLPDLMATLLSSRYPTPPPKPPRATVVKKAAMAPDSHKAASNDADKTEVEPATHPDDAGTAGTAGTADDADDARTDADPAAETPAAADAVKDADKTQKSESDANAVTSLETAVEADDDDDDDDVPRIVVRVVQFTQELMSLMLVPSLWSAEPMAAENLQHIRRIFLGDRNCTYFLNHYGFADPGTPEAISASGPYGQIPRAGACRFFVANINAFGRLGGFHALLHRLERTGDAAVDLNEMSNLVVIARTMQFCYSPSWKALREPSDTVAVAAASDSKDDAATGTGAAPAEAGDAVAATATKTAAGAGVSSAGGPKSVTQLSPTGSFETPVPNYFRRLFDAVLVRIQAATSAELKAISRTLLQDVRRDLDKILTRTLKDDRLQLLELFDLEVSRRLLTSPSLQQRVKALEEIATMVQGASALDDQRNGIVGGHSMGDGAWDPSFHSMGSAGLGYGTMGGMYTNPLHAGRAGMRGRSLLYARANEWVDGDYMLKWLLDNKVADVLLFGRSSDAGSDAGAGATGDAAAAGAGAPAVEVHLQTLSRSKPVLEFLCKRGELSAEQVVTLWQCSVDQEEERVRAVYDILAALARDAEMRLPLIDALFDAFESIRFGSYTESFIGLLKDLTTAALDRVVSAAASRADSEAAGTPRDTRTRSRSGSGESKTDAAAGEDGHGTPKALAASEKKERDRRYGVALLWRAVQDPKEGASLADVLPDNLLRRGLDAVADMLGKERRPHVLRAYMAGCTANLFAGRSVLQALFLLRELVHSTQFSHDASATRAKDWEAPDDVIKKFMVKLITDADGGLVQKVVNDLVRYLEAAKAKSALFKADAAGSSAASSPDPIVSGRYAHSTQVVERLDFVRYLLRQSQRQANFAQVQAIWKAAVEKPLCDRDPEAVYAFLRLCIEDDDVKPGEELLDDATAAKVFTELLCLVPKGRHRKPPALSFGPEGFACFETFFRRVNGVAGRMRDFWSQHRFEVTDADLSGLEILWSVVLRAKNEATIAAATAFLIAVRVRLGMGSSTDRHGFVTDISDGGDALEEEEGAAEKRVWGEFVRRCMDFLRKSVGELDSKAASAAAAAGGQIARVMRLLSRFLSAVEAAAPRSRSRGAGTFVSDYADVNLHVHVKTAPDNPEQTLRVSMDRTDTVSQLRDRIASTLDFPARRLRLQTTHGERLFAREDGRRALYDAGILHSVIAIKLRAMEDDTRGHVPQEGPPPGSLHLYPRQILSNDETYFDLLFDMLTVNNASVVQDAWDLLRRLPTNKRILDDIKTLGGSIPADGTQPGERGFKPKLEGTEFEFDFDAVAASAAASLGHGDAESGDEGPGEGKVDGASETAASAAVQDKSPDWPALFDGANPIKLLYSLRIVESLVFPSDDEAPQSAEAKAFARRWSKEFHMRGGFAHLASVIMSLDLPSMTASVLPNSCLALLAKLVGEFYPNAAARGAAGIASSGEDGSSTPEQQAFAHRLLEIGLQAVEGASGSGHGGGGGGGSASSKREPGGAAATIASVGEADADTGGVGESKDSSADGGGGGSGAASAATGSSMTTSGGADGKVAEAALNTVRYVVSLIVALCQTTPTLWHHLSSVESIRTPFLFGVLHASAMPVRNDVATSIMKLCNTTAKWPGSSDAESKANTPRAVFVDMVLDAMPQVYANVRNAAQILWLLKRLVTKRVSNRRSAGAAGASGDGGTETKGGEAASAASGGDDESDPVVASLDTHELARKIARLIREHPVTEASPEDTDTVLRGLLQAAVALVRNRAPLKEAMGGNGEGEGGLVEYLFEHALFAMPRTTRRNRRGGGGGGGGGGGASGGPKAAVPPPLCKNPSSRRMAFELLAELARDSRANCDALTKLVTPHHEEALTAGRFDITPTHSRRARARLLYGLDEDVDAGRSSTRFVGLENLGCICYMNASLQQFFNVERFRRGLLSFEDESEDPKDSVVFQLQRMFTHLEESEKVAYNPKGFCHAFKDWDGQPTNVGIQKDASEFLTQLFQKLESALMGSPQHKLLRACFSVQTSQELISENHYSERPEAAYFLSVTVKNKKDLHEGLREYVAGEVVDYTWEEADDTKTQEKTTKRTSIAGLPPHLIIHLKRFEFDLNTMEQVKLNDRFAFPRDLDMYPYTAEGRPDKVDPAQIKRAADRAAAIAAKVAQQGGGEAPAGVVGGGGDADDEDDIATGAGDDDDGEGKGGEGEGEAPARLHPDGYYQYKLRGIVVHMGHADGGHYYSYIRDRDADTERWCEFNDRTVSEFPERDIEREAFGGEEAYGSGYTSYSTEKIHSAFLLVYDQVLVEEDSGVDDGGDRAGEAGGAGANVGADAAVSSGAGSEVATAGGADTGGAAASTDGATADAGAATAAAKSKAAARDMGFSDFLNAEASPAVRRITNDIHAQNLAVWRRRNILDESNFEFLWRLVSAATELADKADSATDALGVDAYPASDMCDDEVAMSSKGGGEAVRVARLVLKFVVNTLPNGNVAADATVRWINAMRKLAVSSVSASMWLLQSLMRDTELMMSLLTGFTDPKAASAVATMVAEALTRVLPLEREALGSAEEALKGFKVGSAAPHGFIVAGFIRCVLGLLGGSKSRGVSALGAVVPVLRAFSGSGASERAFLVGAGAIASVVDALMGRRSPVKALRWQLGDAEPFEADGDMSGGAGDGADAADAATGGASRGRRGLLDPPVSRPEARRHGRLAPLASRTSGGPRVVGSMMAYIDEDDSDDSDTAVSGDRLLGNPSSGMTGGSPSSRAVLLNDPDDAFSLRPVDHGPTLQLLISLVRSCNPPSGEDGSPAQLESPGAELPPLDRAVLLDTSVLSTLVREFTSLAKARSMQPLMTHLCWQDEAFSFVVVDVIRAGINHADLDRQKPFFYCALMLLDINDNHVAARTERVMSELAEVLRENASYFYATEVAIAYLVRLVKRSERAAMWVKAHAESFAWMHEWTKANRDQRAVMVRVDRHPLAASHVYKPGSYMTSHVPPRPARLAVDAQALATGKDLDPHHYDSDDEPTDLIGKRVVVVRRRERVQVVVEQYDPTRRQHLVRAPNEDMLTLYLRPDVIYVMGVEAELRVEREAKAKELAEAEAKALAEVKASKAKHSDDEGDGDGDGGRDKDHTGGDGGAGADDGVRQRLVPGAGGRADAGADGKTGGTANVRSDGNGDGDGDAMPGDPARASEGGADTGGDDGTRAGAAAHADAEGDAGVAALPEPEDTSGDAAFAAALAAASGSDDGIPGLDTRDVEGVWSGGSLATGHHDAAFDADQWPDPETAALLETDGTELRNVSSEDEGGAVVPTGIVGATAEHDPELGSWSDDD